MQTLEGHNSMSSADVIPSPFSHLPQHVLENIIFHLRQSIKYDGYLCKLRLVSSQFNEAVLHCLIFEDNPRRFFPTHHTSCGKKCRSDPCVNYGEYNPAYSRYHLQACISRGRNTDLQKLRNFRHLGDALTLLRDDLSSLPQSSISVTRSHLNDHDFLACASVNSVFTNRLSILLCESALMNSKLTGSYDPSFTMLHLRNPAHERYARFWIKNLACYLGDTELLARYWSGTEASWSADMNQLYELTELLAMTAMRGQETLLQLLVCRESLQFVNWPVILRGVLDSGNMHILDIISQSLPQADQIQANGYIYLHSLKYVRSQQSLPPCFNSIAEIILNRQAEIPVRSSDAFAAIYTQVDQGALSIVRQLLQRYHSHEQLGWPTGGRAGESALWRACMNKDLACVKLLMQEGFSHHDWIYPFDYYFFVNCAEAAAHANSWPICEELYRFIGQEVHGMDFFLLAIVDGAIPAMIKRLEADPALLDKEIMAPRDGNKLLGQHVMKLAAKRLRIENTKFFLDKGFRLAEMHSGDFQIEWRYKRKYEQDYDAMQKLLREYNLPLLKVEL